MTAATLTQNTLKSDARTLARSFYQELLKSGLSAKDILAASGELVACVSQDMKRRDAR